MYATSEMFFNVKFYNSDFSFTTDKVEHFIRVDSKSDGWGSFIIAVLLYMNTVIVGHISLNSGQCHN